MVGRVRIHNEITSLPSFVVGGADKISLASGIGPPHENPSLFALDEALPCRTISDGAKPPRRPSRSALQKGLADIARHAVRCHVTKK